MTDKTQELQSIFGLLYKGLPPKHWEEELYKWE